MTGAIPLVLVEDIRLLRDGIAAMLRAQGLKVVAALRGGDEAVRQILRRRPRLVLVDSTLNDHDGVRLVETVATTCPDVKVVVMDVQPSQPDAVDFVRAGAAGFIMRDATADDIVATLRDVANGLYVLPPRLAGVVFSFVAQQCARPARGGAVAGRLTHREWQVIELIEDGLSNKEIAGRLHLSVHTVKSHVHSVLEKLTLRSRVQVAAFARSNRRARRAGI